MRFAVPSCVFASLVIVSACEVQDQSQPTTTTPETETRPTPETTPETTMPDTTQPRDDTQERQMGAAQQDQQIQQRLREHIEQDPALSQYVGDIEVQVRNGVVTLRGEVQSQDHADQLEQDVRQISGVQDVINELEIADEAALEPGEPMEEPQPEPEPLPEPQPQPEG